MVAGEPAPTGDGFVQKTFGRAPVGGASAPIRPIFIAAKTAPTKTDNTPRDIYYLQLDIANFFHSIDRRTLFGMLRSRIERDMRRPLADTRHADAESAQDMLYLARILLTGNPALNADYRGNPAHLKRVPAHKQLANAAPEKGLPIGNLTSQFFANVYLNELDQFVKHTLKANYYVRYVDDFVLLHSDRAVLVAWRTAIIDFLQDRLGLSLRDKGRLAPVANGIDFLGYILRPDYRLVRRRVVGHMKERMARHEKRIVRSNGTLVSPPAASDAVQATLASYCGHFRHAHSARLQEETFARYPWLGHILERDCFDTPPRFAGGFVGGASAPIGFSGCHGMVAGEPAPTGDEFVGGASAPIFDKSIAGKPAPTRGEVFVGGASAPMGFSINHHAVAGEPAPTGAGFVGGASAPIFDRSIAGEPAPTRGEVFVGGASAPIGFSGCHGMVAGEPAPTGDEFVGGASAPIRPISAIAAKAAPTKSGGDGHPKPGGDVRLKRVDRPGIVTSLASQWSYFRARYPQHVLLVQVGNRWECQGTQDAEIPSVFRRLRSNRPGLPQTWAIPAASVPALKRQLTRRRQPWCEVCENGYLKGGMKRRQFVALWPAWPVSTESIQGNLP
jgi:hypothetical protein